MHGMSDVLHQTPTRCIFSVHQHAIPDPLNVRFCILRCCTPTASPSLRGFLRCASRDEDRNQGVFGSLETYIRSKHVTQIDADDDPSADFAGNIA